MSLYDDILRLFGTNRTRMRWRLQRMRDSLSREKRSLANRSQALVYEHQLCPSCGHPAGKDEKTCTRCGARLQGVAVQRASKVYNALVPEGVPVVTVVYLLVCGLMFYVTKQAAPDFLEMAGDEQRAYSYSLIRYGANVRELVEHGEWWRLVTANYLHGGGMHLAFNVYGLWVAGSVIEDRFGPQRTAVVLVVTGVTGALASYLFSRGFSVGASTAGFGLIAFVVGHVLRYHDASLRSRFVPWLLYGVIVSFSPGIDFWGHIGGAAGGLVLGVLVADKQNAKRWPAWVWTVMALACVGVVAWAFVQAARWDILA